MKDIHTHILNGIDDGSKTVEESINIIKKAKKAGITEIVLTPHYINKSNYNCNNKNKIELFNVLQEEVKKNNIDVKLYLGNEVMIDIDIVDLLKNKEIMSINNTRYVLVEFSMDFYNKNIKNIIFDMVRNNYIPIIAHPERYLYVQNDISIMDDFIQMGAILQGNYLSLLSFYGNKSKKTLIKLLKDGKIALLASDIHHSDRDYYIDEALKKLKRVIKSDEKIDNLLNKNFDKIINDEDLEDYF